MGYYVSTTDVNLTIPQEKVKNAFQAAIDMNTDRGFQAFKSGGSSTGERWFSWVSDNYHETAGDLIDVTDEEFRFQGSFYDDEGNFHLGEFDSKVGDEGILFDVLAPYVEDGSHVEWLGEEGERWRWVFKEGKKSDQYPNVSWN